MPFDWIDYLKLAQTLALKGDEASKRAAISRAYYFIFNLAYARIENNCGSKPQGPPGHHEWCWGKFIRNSNSDCRAVGTTGVRLKRLRRDVDYKSQDIPRLDEVCSRMLLDVQELHADLSNLNPALPR